VATKNGLLEDLGSVVLPVAKNGHAELSAMPALCIVLLELLMYIWLIPAQQYQSPVTPSASRFQQPCTAHAVIAL